MGRIDRGNKVTACGKIEDFERINQHKHLRLTEEHHRMNWPFPSFPGPLFQNEGRCSAFNMEIIFHSLANETHFHKKSCAPSLILKVRVFGTRKWPIVFNNWRTLAMRTPRYNGHHDNTDSSKIPGKNKLQTFD